MFDSKAPTFCRVRNASTGVFFEVMGHPGLYAERLQRALLQRRVPSPWERMVRALGDWLTGRSHG